MKIWSILTLMCLALGLSACGGDSSDGNTGGRKLSPHEVSFGEISLYATRKSVESAIKSLRCPKSGYDAEVCIWRPGKKDREMEGIEEVRFTFRQGIVKGIEVRYAQIFDVQYKGVNRMVRERYGPTGSENAIDSVDRVWKYDSLTVSLTPNRKQHWTGSFYVFTPILNIQETLPARKGDGENQE